MARNLERRVGVPYQLLDDEPVSAGVARIVREQIDRAAGELTADELGPHEGIHQARKRFKKIRAVLRLVRPRLGDVYAVENAWWRDAGRRLAQVRDATAVIESFDGLGARFAEPLAARAL